MLLKKKFPTPFQLWISLHLPWPCWRHWVTNADSITPSVYFGCYGVIVSSGCVTCCVGIPGRGPDSTLGAPSKGPREQTLQRQQTSLITTQPTELLPNINVIWHLCKSKPAQSQNFADRSSGWVLVGFNCSNVWNPCWHRLQSRRQNVLFYEREPWLFTPCWNRNLIAPKVPFAPLWILIEGPHSMSGFEY